MVLPDVGNAIEGYVNSEFGNYEYLKSSKDQADQFPNDSKVYTDLMRRAMSDSVRNNKKKVKQVVIDLFNAGRDGKINNASMREVLGEIAGEFQHAAVDERLSVTRKIKSMVTEYAHKTFEYLPNPEKALEDFIKTYGQIPQDATDEERRKKAVEIVANITRRSFPQLVGLDQVPENIIDAFGIVKRIWNGEIKSVGPTEPKKQKKPSK